MNLSWGLVAAALLAVSGAGATDLEDLAKKLIEDFRTIMPTGRPDINIPVLDPAVIAKLPINVNLSPFDAKVVASNIQVAGVQGFEFTKISQISGTNNLAVEVQLPDINVNGEYDMDGKVKVGFVKVKLNGQGPLKLTIKGLKGAATVDLQLNADGIPSVTALKVDSWTYSDITIELDNLFNGGVMGKTVNKLINKLVPTFVSLNRAKINSMVENMGTLVINRYLDGIAGRPQHLTVTRLMTAHHTVLSLEALYVPAEAQQILNQLAQIAAAPREAAATDLETRAAKIIEDFRAIMPTGRPDINWPVTEPALLKELPITVKMSPFDATAVASNILIAGVSAFKFTKLSQIEGTNKLSVALEVPEVNVNGEYDLKGKVKIGFIKVGLNGDGPLTLNLKGLKATATVDVLVNSDNSLNVNSIQVDSWTYDKITIQLDNLFNGGVMGDTVNILINKLAPTFINANKDKINKIAETIGVGAINKYLDGINGKVTKVNTLLHRMPALHEAAVDDFVITPEAQEILDQIALIAVNAHRMAPAA